jgi:polyhydroxyalkanoate synthesis repressor PhaR
MNARRLPPEAATEAGAASPATGARVLKKYPNRRLYDTQGSTYITLADVKRMVIEGQAFEVRDAKSGEDLTRSILLQIILEEEAGGTPMFSAEALAQIIRFYGHTMQGAMGSMIEKNLAAFVEMQGQLINGQAPLVQQWMKHYTEQSQAMWDRMAEQMGEARRIFPGFPPAKR